MKHMKTRPPPKLHDNETIVVLW